MRGTTTLRLVLLMGLLMGCNQMSELGGEAPACSDTEPCQEGQVCVDEICVKSPATDEPDPEIEREADDLGKLGVERDMLQSKVQLANEALADAIEELAEAKTDAQKRAAQQKKDRATDRQKAASLALRRFLKANSR